ncbi:Uncharacterized protein TCM_036847 [Theobroma cacao]|uniref:Uncharacterized protein n=1 Tax=Theobroma cacao TaxID=3641 RepID=A0A061GIA7_THECC|nr:Uncharacterized protein TCM_036847 [Theobroma cacao]
MSGVKVREGHVDAAQPNLPKLCIQVKNHPHINRDAIVVLCNNHMHQQNLARNDHEVEKMEERAGYCGSFLHLH